MIRLLQILFGAGLIAMLLVTGWATSHCAVWRVPAEVVQHPWFIATLFDTYFAFLAFWLWVAYREKTWPTRLGWLLGILLLGNIAMAVYMLLQLRRLEPNAGLRKLFEPGSPSGRP